MAFYIEHRSKGPGKALVNKASPLEIAAEEFLNGLLCHYEPPQHPSELPGIDFEDQLMLRRPPSILKTSRSFEKKSKSKKGRSVRWNGVNFKDGNKQRHHRPNLFKKLKCRKEKF